MSDGTGMGRSVSGANALFSCSRDKEEECREREVQVLSVGKPVIFDELLQICLLNSDDPESDDSVSWIRVD